VMSHMGVTGIFVAMLLAIYRWVRTGPGADDQVGRQTKMERR
jgi:hypothetical protein